MKRAACLLRLISKNLIINSCVQDILHKKRHHLQQNRSAPDHLRKKSEWEKPVIVISGGSVIAFPFGIECILNVMYIHIWGLVLSINMTS